MKQLYPWGMKVTPKLGVNVTRSGWEAVLVSTPPRVALRGTSRSLDFPEIYDLIDAIRLWEELDPQATNRLSKTNTQSLDQKTICRKRMQINAIEIEDIYITECQRI